MSKQRRKRDLTNTQRRLLEQMFKEDKDIRAAAEFRGTSLHTLRLWMRSEAFRRELEATAELQRYVLAHGMLAPGRPATGGLAPAGPRQAPAGTGECPAGPVEDDLEPMTQAEVDEIVRLTQEQLDA